MGTCQVKIVYVMLNSTHFIYNVETGLGNFGHRMTRTEIVSMCVLYSSCPMVSWQTMSLMVCGSPLSVVDLKKESNSWRRR